MALLTDLSCPERLFGANKPAASEFIWAYCTEVLSKVLTKVLKNPRFDKIFKSFGISGRILAGKFLLKILVRYRAVVVEIRHLDVVKFFLIFWRHSVFDFLVVRIQVLCGTSQLVTRASLINDVLWRSFVMTRLSSVGMCFRSSAWIPPFKPLSLQKRTKRLQ